MMELDEDAVLCDLAETYGIFDIHSLPIGTIATLAVGLGDNSRIKRRIRQEQTGEEPLDLNTILLAQILDADTLLLWSRTKDGQKGRNRPKSVLDALLGRDKKKKPENEKPMAFDTPEEFEVMWKQMGGGGS